MRCAHVPARIIFAAWILRHGRGWLATELRLRTQAERAIWQSGVDCVRAALSGGVLAALVTVCVPADRESSGTITIGLRTIDASRWDTLYVVGGGPEDTTLLRTRLIAAGGGVLYAYDYGDSRLKAFDSRGTFRWAFGEAGAGPGEFRNPTHVSVADDGRIWVTDGGAGRITVVNPDGALDRHLSFDGRLIQRVIPRANMRLVFPSTSELLMGCTGCGWAGNRGRSSTCRAIATSQSSSACAICS